MATVDRDSQPSGSVRIKKEPEEQTALSKSGKMKVKTEGEGEGTQAEGAPVVDPVTESSVATTPSEEGVKPKESPATILLDVGDPPKSPSDLETDPTLLQAQQVANAMADERRQEEEKIGYAPWNQKKAWFNEPGKTEQARASRLTSLTCSVGL